MGSVVRNQLEVKVLPLAEALLVVLEVQSPVPSFQWSFLDLDFHNQSAFAVWIAGWANRLFTRFIVSTFFWSTIFAYTSVILILL